MAAEGSVATERAAADVAQGLRQQLLTLELAELEARCMPPEGAAISPALRTLAVIRGRVLDSCADRIRDLVNREVERKPIGEALTRGEVRAMLKRATEGLFPEAEDGAAVDDDSSEDEDDVDAPR